MLKSLTRLLLALALCGAFFSPKSFAQVADSAYISGPATLCVGECATYEMVLPDSLDVLQILWSNGSGEILGAGSQFDYCPVSLGPPGFALLSAEFWTTSQEHYVFSLTIFISNNLTPAIVAVSAACPPDSSSSCQKVCANTTATYEVPSIGGGVYPVTWTVQGAEDFEANGNSVTVQWGAPGQGEVTATVGGSGTGYPVQIFCGQAGIDFNQPGTMTGSGYVQIFGAASPALVVIEGPNGYTFSQNWTGGIIHLPGLEAGSYEVKVTGADGSMTTCSFNIVVTDSECWANAYPMQLSPAFTCSSCDGFVQVVAVGNTTQYSFQWSNGATTPSISNLCPGIYSLTVVDGLGCSSTMNVTVACPSATCSGSASLCVDILEDAQAAIGSQPPANANDIIAVCQGQTVFFENHSLHATSYAWDFGDFQTSAAFEPSHQFNTPGTYLVMLVARNECFCADTAFVEVYVLPAQTPEIECVGTLCEGETATYTTPANCGSYDWSLTGSFNLLAGGGAGDNFVTVEWLAGPEGMVSLTTTACAGSACSLPNIVPIAILSENVQIQGDDKVCQNSTEEYFIPNYQGTEINWQVLGSGTIVSPSGAGGNRITVHWFGDAGIGNPQRVIVEFQNCYLGCSGRDTLEVSIVPEFYVTGPIQVCQNTTGTFQSRNAITDVLMPSNWQLLDAAEAVVWTSAAAASTANVLFSQPPGSYTVRAEPAAASGFCNERYDVFVKITAAPPAPTGILGETDICPGTAYSYEAQGLPASNFTWSVTGGLPSVAHGNPVNVVWGSAPPYSLSVVQVAAAGLACASLPTVFGVNPLPDFDISGDAQICREATGNYSAPLFENLDYQWTVSPADAGTIVAGQGSASADVLWHAAGAATVGVSVCGFSKTFNVSVLALPEPFVPDGEVCAGQTIPVTTSAAFASFVWRDESAAQVSNAASPMLGGGSFEVEVTDLNGCRGDTTFEIVERPLPQVSVSTPSYFALCFGGPPVTLHALATGGGYGYQWFHEGAPVGANTSTHTTSLPGVYLVIATDGYGCENTAGLQLFDCGAVGGTCVAGACLGGGGGPPLPGCAAAGNVDFTSSTGADCATLNFTNTSTNYVPGSFLWQFNDPPGSAASFDLSHDFSQAGFYTVILTGALNAAGGGSCGDGVLHDVLVTASADFAAGDACPGEPLLFEDRTVFVPPGSVTGWLWDFGDPGSGAANTSALQNPTHAYAAPGSYTATLTVTEAGGCESSISKNVTVRPLPDAIFLPPTLTCENAALPFSPFVFSEITSASWNFGDPASGAANTSQSESTFHEFDAPGTYAVLMTTANVFGCTATFTDNVTVTANPLSGVIALAPPSPICEGDVSTLSAPAGGTAWEWSTGEATSSITASTSGIYSVTLTNGEGCTYAPPPALLDVTPEPNGTIQAVEYNEFGQPVAFFENSHSVCEGEDVTLLVQGSASYGYTWSNGEAGGEISFTEDKGNLLPVGSHSFTVTVTDNLTGCTSIEGPFTVTVNPVPTVAITSSPPGFLCENNAATLNVTAPQGGVNYVWNTGELGASISVISGGIYFARAINSFGCEGRSNEVEVHNSPDIDLIPTGCHTRCQPDTMCLPDVPDLAAVQWFLDGNPIAAPNGTQQNPVFTQSGTYTVEMTDLFGCSSISGSLTLDLFTGFGAVGGTVWFDVNENGVVDAPDTTVSGVNVFLQNGGGNIDTIASNSGGNYNFIDILATNYSVVVDTANLPPGWSAVQVSADVELTGCDDEETADWLLTIACTPSASALDTSACAGSAVLVAGTPVLAGDQINLVVTNWLGCDSTVTVTVAELPHTFITLNEAVCEGEFFTWLGQQIPAGTEAVFTQTNAFGCPDTTLVAVAALPPASGSEALSACSGESALYAGTPVPAGTSQAFTLTSAAGCDSIVTVTVAELPHSVLVVDAVACEGDSLLFQGIQILAGTEVVLTEINAFGCLDTTFVAVLALPPSASSLALTACPGSSVTYQGQALFPGDVQDFVFQNLLGCDSVVTVTVSPGDTNFTAVDLQACPGAFAEFLGEPLPPGADTIFILTNQDGCDSLVHVVVTGLPSVSYDLDASAVCWNANDGSILVSNVQGSAAPYLFSLDGTSFQPEPDFTGLAGGIYTVFLQDENDCVFEEEIEVPVIPPMAVLAADETLDCGDSVRLAPQVVGSLPLTWEWTGGSAGESLTVGAPGVYNFKVSNACETVERSIAVTLADSAFRSPVYLPNAFSPNGDGVNDCFRGYVSPEVELLEYQLLVFDRWGDQMFETHDIEGCWDGKFRGEWMDPAVFAWFITMKVRHCDGSVGEVFKEGGVTIVK